jgi:hypothetical protein
VRKVIVGFSGGVTSAECAILALEEYPRDEVVLLWHDTKREDVDTLHFMGVIYIIPKDFRSRECILLFLVWWKNLFSLKRSTSFNLA